MKCFQRSSDLSRLFMVSVLTLFLSAAAFANEITGIKEVETVEVEFQTPYEDAMAQLPETVYVTLSEGDPVAADVEWELDQPWLLSTFGNYTAIGTVTLPDGVAQSDPATPLEVSTTLRMNSGRNLIPGTLQAAEWVADQAGCSTRKPMEQIAATEENLDLRELPLWTSREDALLIHEHFPTSADIHTWTDCDHGYEIVAYGIQDGGHVWPGGNQFVVASTVGPASFIIDATRVIWDHLSQFTLP